jgi:hypothetical protein
VILLSGVITFKKWTALKPVVRCQSALTKTVSVFIRERIKKECNGIFLN